MVKTPFGRWVPRLLEVKTKGIGPPGMYKVDAALNNSGLSVAKITVDRLLHIERTILVVVVSNRKKHTSNKLFG